MRSTFRFLSAADRGHAADEGWRRVSEAHVRDPGSVPCGHPGGRASARRQERNEAACGWRWAGEGVPRILPSGRNRGRVCQGQHGRALRDRSGTVRDGANVEGGRRVENRSSEVERSPARQM